MPDSLYRERFRLTMAHQPVDRCPLDLGGMPQSAIEERATEQALAAWLGLAGEPPADYDKMDRRILEHFDIDLRRVGGMPAFTTGREQRLSDTEFVDSFGIRHRFSGIYWEIVGGPLAGASRDEVAAYELPRPDQMAWPQLDDWAERARRLYEGTPYVVVGEHPVLGVLELACWLAGYDHVMMMLALDEEWVHLLFGKILEFQRWVCREYYNRLGRFLHVTTSGDDFGTQKGMFISPAMWRRLVKPYMAERIAFTRRLTDAVYLHHSCGGILDIVPDLAETGVGILNPIQPGAAGMDPAGLKSLYGDRLVFHGGLDTQRLLPAGDVPAIESAVAELLAAMHPGDSGGYVFAPAHNLQRDVSPAAITAMYRAAARA